MSVPLFYVQLLWHSSGRPVSESKVFVNGCFHRHIRYFSLVSSSVCSHTCCLGYRPWYSYVCITHRNVHTIQTPWIMVEVFLVNTADRCQWILALANLPAARSFMTQCCPASLLFWITIKILQLNSKIHATSAKYWIHATGHHFIWKVTVQKCGLRIYYTLLVQTWAGIALSV